MSFLEGSPSLLFPHINIDDDDDDDDENDDVENGDDDDDGDDDDVRFRYFLPTSCKVDMKSPSLSHSKPHKPPQIPHKNTS